MHVTVSDLPPGEYHWQAQAVDQNTNPSNWIAFGGGGTDVRVQAPADPTNLAQSDGSNPIASGGLVPGNGTSVVLSAVVSDSDVSSSVDLQVEVQPARPSGELVTGTPLTRGYTATRLAP